jgi:hypothetical protein
MVDIITTVFTGICNGLGTATGSYLAVRYATKHIDKLDARLRERLNTKEEDNGADKR